MRFGIIQIFTKMIIRANEAIYLWDKFRWDTDSEPFAYAVKLCDFAYWVPWKHSLPSFAVRRLLSANEKLFNEFYN